MKTIKLTVEMEIDVTDKDFKMLVDGNFTTKDYFIKLVGEDCNPYIGIMTKDNHPTTLQLLDFINNANIIEVKL